MEYFEIQSELLKQAMWGGHWCKNGFLQHTNGYFNYDENYFGRSFIEFCVKKIFSIQRFPGFENFYSKEYKYKYQKEFSNLMEGDVLLACNELKRYYNFLQEELLKPEYGSKDGKMRVSRCLKPFEIEDVTPQILDEKEKIVLPANVITSYAHQRGDWRYGTTMYIEREVDISKIILWEETLVGPDGKCEHSFWDTEKEVWVIEDSIWGETEVDISCFHYRGELHNGFRHKYYFNQEDNPVFVPRKDSPKPCEWNKFTKWLIRKNMKEIERLYQTGKFEN